MEYKGKLYGKLGHKKYFDTGKKSDDYDALVNRVQELERALAKGSIEDSNCNLSDVIHLGCEKCGNDKFKIAEPRKYKCTKCLNLVYEQPCV